MVLLLSISAAAPLEPLTASDPTGPEQTDVVGGAPVTHTEWPDAVAIQVGTSVGCSGVLVAPTLVLTAAHCSFGIDTVVLNTNDYEAPSSEVIAVTDVHVYPDWFSTLDAALVVLEEPSTVPPRPIASDCIADVYLQQGAEVAIVGFGATDTYATEHDSLLYEASTTITDAACSETPGCLMVGSELAAGGDGIDSCDGDSGGPLYLRTEDGDFLAGITSRAVATMTVPCGDGGIYVRADALTEWVLEETGLSLTRPRCDGLNSAPVATVGSPLVVGLFQVETVKVAIDDPNPEDRHTLSVISAPRCGVATTSDAGLVSYALAGHCHQPEDRFTVRVTDDGSPPLHTDVEIVARVPMGVTAGEVAGACTTGGAGAPSWNSILTWAARR